MDSEELGTLARRRKDCSICMRRDPGQIFNGSQEGLDPPTVSYWSQWLGHPRPSILIVGQDFGDIGYFIRNQGRDEINNATNDNLRVLLCAAGLIVGKAPNYDGSSPVFLTNSILCLKSGGMNAQIKERWVRTCAATHLEPLVQVLRAPVIVGMGKHGWSAVRRALQLNSTPARISEAAGGHWTTPTGQEVFAVGHCSGLGLANRSWAQQLTDWRAIGPSLAQVTSVKRSVREE